MVFETRSVDIAPVIAGLPTELGFEVLKLCLRGDTEGCRGVSDTGTVKAAAQPMLYPENSPPLF